MSDLFGDTGPDAGPAAVAPSTADRPLADRIRPRSLGENMSYKEYEKE